jgi:hypothetical protein
MYLIQARKRCSTLLAASRHAMYRSSQLSSTLISGRIIHQPISRDIFPAKPDPSSACAVNAAQMSNSSCSSPRTSFDTVGVKIAVYAFEGYDAACSACTNVIYVREEMITGEARRRKVHLSTAATTCGGADRAASARRSRHTGSVVEDEGEG